jgi:ribose transport system ATP-binding protein
MRHKVLSFEGISKSFGAIHALNDVSFDVLEGEVLGLLGANGAGKSTLLKIIGGILDSDSGQIRLDNSVYSPKSAFDAKLSGVISINQELNVFTNMTVAENLFLGSELKTKIGTIDWKRMYNEADLLLKSMELPSISGRGRMEDLSVANRQIVEIARAINEDPRILLLDEPTASLSEDQAQWLFNKINDLSQKGTTVIYVSHRLEEVLQICDRVVILRDGVLVATLTKEEMTRDLIVKHMVGQDLVTAVRTKGKIRGAKMLSCNCLTLASCFSDITFDVFAGEILGIAGLVGSGRSELLNCLYGVYRPDDGNIIIKETEVKINHPRDAIEHGIAMVSEDRKKEGLFLPETTTINITASTLDRRSKLGFIDQSLEKSQAETMVKNVLVDSTRLETPVGQLSGGNQQKVYLGKALLQSSDILLLDEPTRGVDVGARDEIYNLIKKSANDGKAIVLVSSDWEELTKYADRVLVMSEGKVVGELTGNKLTEETILHLCTERKSLPTHRTEPSLRQSLRSVYASNSNAWILAGALLFLIATGVIATEFFLLKNNLNNLIWQSMIYQFLTIGQMIVVLAGGIDLSLSANMTVSSIIGMKLFLAFPDKLWLGMLVMLVFGLAVGIINGIFVVRLRVDAFVSTLAVQMILQGSALIMTPKPMSPAPGFLKTIANRTFLSLPIILYIAVIVFIIFYVILNWTVFGRHLRAVGENAIGASWLGLRADRIKMSAFVIASLMGVIAGYYALGRNGAAEPVVDAGLTLNSIAYALIGGGTLAGGQGSLAGSALAVLVITVLLNILNHLGVSTNFQDIVRGSVIMVILIAYAARHNKSKQLETR